MCLLLFWVYIFYQIKIPRIEKGNQPAGFAFPAGPSSS